jgi:hypothetical protein
MNAQPVKIFRQCPKCLGDFAIKQLSSRATYCPACRKGLVQQFVSEKHQRLSVYLNDKKKAA